MDYQKVKLNREQFLSLTTLYPEEFEVLLSAFRIRWHKFYRFYTLEGKRRNKSNWRPEKDTPTLPKVEDKLFFLLTYFKQHPLQQFQASSFGLSQAKVSLWIKILTPLLEQSLKSLDCLPSRQGSELADYLKAFGHIRVVSHDVVEQTTPRPLDDEAQKAQYSGKKKPIPTKTK